MISSINSSTSWRRYRCTYWSHVVDLMCTSFNSKTTDFVVTMLFGPLKRKKGELLILHFFCPLTESVLMMMSRSRTRLLVKKSSKKGGRKRAKRNTVCSSIFSFVVLRFNKSSLLLLMMMMRAIRMSENFEYFPTGVEGKKQRKQPGTSSSSSSSFEAFQDERREKRGTIGLQFSFFSRVFFLVFSLAFVSRVFYIRLTQQTVSE